MSSGITCPNCGQKNRINGSADGTKAICAKCWTKLNVPKQTVQAPPPPKEAYTPPPQSQSSRGRRRGQSGWIWLLVVGGVIWWGMSQESSSTRKPASSSAKPSLSKPAPTYPEVALPYNGDTQMFSQGARIAPFEIKTSRGANYLVKLVSVGTGQPVMTIFVRGGNTVSTEVPLGTYEVKYASGEKWYGHEHLFGPDTSYSKADTQLRFENRGGQISGYTITLYRVTNGNMRTKSIKPEQF